MQSLIRRGHLRRTTLFQTVILLAIALAPTKIVAQETTFLDPPKSDSAAAYEELARRENIRTEIQYIDETSLDLFQADRSVARDIDQPIEREFSGFGSLNGMGTFIVVGFLVLLIFLFLKFGAGGTLLARDPSQSKKKKKRAKGWGLSSADANADDILSQVRGMKDRRAALILLLRHCLLQAADETDTRFKRADTEREALARLPDTWRKFVQLKGLLFRTELVHYGGRDIAEDDFLLSLRDGAAILKSGQPHV